MDTERRNSQGIMQPDNENDDYPILMEVTRMASQHTMPPVAALQLQHTQPQSYVYVGNMDEPSVVSKLTLDKAIYDTADDDIPSKLYLPGDNSNGPAGALGQHLEEQDVQNNENLSRYRDLMQKYNELKAQEAEIENDQADDEDGVAPEHSGKMQKYPTEGFHNTTSSNHDEDDGEYEGSPARIGGAKDDNYWQDPEQPLMHDDPEQQSNHYDNVMDHDEGERQSIFRSSSSPHQTSDIDRLESSFDMVPVEKTSSRRDCLRWIMPLGCFCSGVGFVFAFLVLMNMLDLSVFGYDFSFESSNTKSETKSNPSDVAPTLAPTMAERTSAPVPDAPPAVPLNLVLSRQFDSADASFGSKVAISGLWMASSAPGSSKVTIYLEDNDSWIQLPDIEGTENTAFGADIHVASSLDSNDAILVVGAPEADQVLLYSLQSSVGTWEPLGSPLTGDTRRRELAGGSSSRFGSSVAMSQNRVVVGAPMNSLQLENGGSIHVSHLGSQTNFALFGIKENARFGSDVDISPSGNSIVVGEPGQSSFTIFEWNGSEWLGVFTEAFSGDFDLGTSASFLSNDYIVLGAPSANNGGGRLRFFKRGSQNMWTELPSLAGNRGDRIGAFATVSGTQGEYGPEVVLSKSNGELKRFDLRNGEWRDRFTQKNNVVATSLAVRQSNDKYAVFAGFGGADRAILFKVEEMTNAPTSAPSMRPTPNPTAKSTPNPTPDPTNAPTLAPTPRPTVPPGTPTLTPSSSPSLFPTTVGPTGFPTASPTNSPTNAPTPRPTVPPGTPTLTPSSSPSSGPSNPAPTASPSRTPTPEPTPAPTSPPTVPPGTPTASPISTESPTQSPTSRPTPQPTNPPTQNPTLQPTSEPAWVLMAGPETGSGLNSGHGSSIAIAGSYMIIGEPLSSSVGKVQIYGSSPSWSRKSSIIDFGTKAFGSSVDLAIVSGQASALIGAPDTRDSGGQARFGSVGYYEFDNQGVWTQIGSTQTPGFNFFDAAGDFGKAVAMATTIRRFAAAAPDSTLNSTEVDTGKIYTYEHNGQDWQSMTVDPIIGTAGSKLGTSLDMSNDGSYLFTGAPLRRGGDGSVYYYKWNQDTSTWDRVFSLSGGTGESMGTSVSIISDDGSLIAFGSPDYGDSQGVIRVYRDIGGFFLQRGPDIIGSSNQKIGTTLCGAQGHVAFGTNTGSFHVYEYQNGSWDEIATGPSTGSPVVSISMAEDGNTIAVGLANEESFVYTLQ